MYGRPRGGVQRQGFPDAGHDAEVLYMPGTSGCFFYDSYRRKGSSVPEPCEFEVGRRLAGGRQGEYPKDGDSRVDTNINRSCPDIKGDSRINNNMNRSLPDMDSNSRIGNNMNRSLPDVNGDSRIATNMNRSLPDVNGDSRIGNNMNRSLPDNVTARGRNQQKYVARS